MLTAMEPGSLRARLRAVGIFVLAAGTLYWLVQVIVPVAEFWGQRAAEHLEGVRPLSYFERRDPATCPAFGAGREDCVHDAIAAQRDWAATRRALRSLAWDIDRFLWSALINLGVGLAPLLIVWRNSRRNLQITDSELY